MKFDKIMNFSYKFIAFAVCVAVAIGCVSCCVSSLTAHALSYDEIMLDTAVGFKDAAESRLVEVGSAINADLASGNIDASTEEGKKILQAVALQVLYMQNPAMGTILHAIDLATQTVPDFSALDELPENTYFSVAGITGLYRSDLDHNLHSVYIPQVSTSPTKANALTFTFALSDEFSYTLEIQYPNSDYNVWVSAGSFDASTGYYSFYLHDSGGIRSASYHIYDTNNNYNSFQGSLNSYSQADYILGLGTSSSASYNISYVNRLLFRSSPFTYFGRLAATVSAPSASVPTLQPWKYYNDTLLPYIYNTYGDINNTYILFPNGYQPTPTPDPTEPATFPNGGIWIGDNYDIDINYYTPTDSSGQPLTDAQGETVTETYAVSDTRPTDAVYNFHIPTLPHIEKYSAENIVPDLSTFSEGIKFVFGVTSDIFQESGFLPVVVAVLSLGAVAAVLMIL